MTATGSPHDRTMDTTAPQPDAAHEGATLPAVLLAEGPLSAGVALIDGHRPPRSGFRQHDGRSPGIPAPAVGSGPARVGAELLAPDGGEGGLADGTSRRDAIVTRRGWGVTYELATARRVASARARWLRIR